MGSKGACWDPRVLLWDPREFVWDPRMVLWDSMVILCNRRVLFGIQVCLCGNQELHPNGVLITNKSFKPYEIPFICQ